MTCDTALTSEEITDLTTNVRAVSDWAEGGPANTATMANGRVVPSPSKAIADSKLFKEPVAYSAAVQYTDATQPVIESGIIYAPNPSFMPIGPEAFDSSHWYVLQGGGIAPVPLDSLKADGSFLIGEFRFSSEYTTGTGVGAGLYEKVSGDPGDNLINPATGDGNWLKLTIDTPVRSTMAGAGTVDDTAILNEAINFSDVNGYRSNSDILGTVSVPLSKRLENLILTYTGANQAVAFTGDNSIISGLEITSDFHGIQNSTPVNNTFFMFNKVTATRYALLYNDSANGSASNKILFNELFADEADAVEINNPSQGNGFTLIAGNTLSGGLNGLDANSGFGVGVAGGKGHITALNYCSGSRKRAYHVEDLQFRGVVLGNIWENCKLDGIYILPQTLASLPTKADGILSVGNHVEFGGVLKTARAGIIHAFPSAAEGSLNNCIGTANYIKGFGYGIEMPAEEICHYDGNAVIDADIAVVTRQESISIGDNITDETPILLESDRGSVIGGLHSKTEPTQIINHVGVATSAGGTIQRFSFKKALATIPGDSTQHEYDLFDSPTLMMGKVTVIAQSSVSFFVAIADLTWDGTTLTQVSKVTKSAGDIFATINFTENAGKINIEVASASSVTTPDITVLFDGVYYQE